MQWEPAGVRRLSLWLVVGDGSARVMLTACGYANRAPAEVSIILV